MISATMISGRSSALLRQLLPPFCSGVSATALPFLRLRSSVAASEPTRRQNDLAEASPFMEQEHADGCRRHGRVA